MVSNMLVILLMVKVIMNFKVYKIGMLRIKWFWYMVNN